MVVVHEPFRLLQYPIYTRLGGGEIAPCFCSPHGKMFLFRDDSMPPQTTIWENEKDDNNNYHRRVPLVPVCPCGKQHFREIATPDWVGTLRIFTHTLQYVLFVKWPTQSGVAISRKCCFPHGRLLDNLPQWGENFDKHCHLHLWFTRVSKRSPHWGDCPKNGDEWHTPVIIGFESMCDICFLSWSENHNNMHHRASTRSIHRSMCDVRFHANIGQMHAPKRRFWKNEPRFACVFL